MSLYKVSFFVGIFIIIFGFCFALLFDDPYLFRRFGALTTGYAACLVLLQIALENNFEAQKEESKLNDSDELSPVKEKWLRKRNDKKFLFYSQKRMSIALIVASLALLGEIVHGFGDFLVKIFI
ncbi:hypothetical protein [Stappia sp. ES.058]|uniref:hypothetical protein n=1 Tax=Stappia sp. ES.058 TaxID=1881061 RepID=UPI0012FDF844|nr:hypothetical protein [Stappia sp. ES.058]